MVTTPSFYNLKDQGIYAAGDFFIPQERYRAAPYNAASQPNNPDEVPAGIPAIYQARGGDNFGPFNPDMSKIRTDFKPEYDFRQASEINSKTFNPQSTFDPNLFRAQNTANLIRNYESGTGPGVMRLGKTVFDVKDYSPDQRTSMLKSADDFIDDARMQYATEGQFVDQYDPRYSSETEARKFMDNYPDYYYGPPKTDFEKLASKAINFIPGIGTVSRIAGFLKDKMPINERAILENQLRGQGVLTDDIGRIVAQQGQYNTPEGIMAGYNANMMTDKTFDKRTGNISKSLQNRTSLTEQQINDIVNEIATTGKYSGTLTDEDLGVNNLFSNLVNVNRAKFNFLKTQEKSAAIAKFKKEQREAAEAAKASAALEAQRRGRRPGSGGDGPTTQDTAASQGLSPGDPGAGTGGYSYDSGGRQGFGYGLADGGRVAYIDGGLADMLEIYD